MKDKLIVFGHIVVIIIIYILSFVLPGTITSLFDFPERIDFFRIIIGSLLAIIIFVFGSKLYVERVMKLKLSDFRVNFKKVDTFWLIVSLLVPILVVLFYFITDRVSVRQGESDLYHTVRFFMRLIFVGGLLAGIGEEIFFRGILMGYLEKNFGIVYAIIIPSLLFGAPHLINIDTFSISIIIQVTVFITLYGVIMSLIVYYTNNIWNSITLHISWNIITGMIINYGEVIDSNFVLQMKEKGLFWNGGDYGLDVSIVGLTGLSIIGFLVFLQKWKNSRVTDFNQ